MKIFSNRLEMVASVAEGSIGAEIGVQAGEFSRQLLTLPIKRLYLIDPWKHQVGSYASDISNIDQGGMDSLHRAVVEEFTKDFRVEIWRKSGFDVGLNFFYLEWQTDWVYIDGNHSEGAVYADLMIWSRNLNTRGVIMGHDYTNRPEANAQGFGVVDAVDKFCADEGWTMTAITSEDWPSYMLEKI